MDAYDVAYSSISDRADTRKIKYYQYILLR